MRMKHCTSQSEDNEFSLDTALELRCMNVTNVTTCGACQTCLLAPKIREFREWFFRFGDHSKKQFMLGLLQRIKSTALLKNMVLLLQSTITKDCIYARARTNPSLDTDTATVSSDHAISTHKIEKVITATWEWFSCANYWTKLNFMLSILQMCEVHLLHTLYRQAHTLLAAELKASEALIDYKDEATSITSTEYSHRSDEHPELEFLSVSRAEYSPIVKNPFTGDIIPNPSESTISYSTISTSSLSGASSSSMDPMILVLPTSAKAYAGVSRYKDYIRCLPVHLSKMILSMLDTVSLYNALCVSPNWRRLVEEVRLEISVNQQIKEEVMLMQGAGAQNANPTYAKDIDVLVPNLEPGTHELIYTNDDVIKTTFKSEHSFQTAYSGISTKKVITEERNIYCGAYNVMVVVNTEDSHRVMHTDGSSWIAVGSKDRKVRFVDCDTGKQAGPVITGHAGSITCCFLLHDKGVVLSGSYDTSVRCWSTETGKCMKILRGHQDTVNCITVLGDVVATGAMDKTCKIWSLETGKCQKTFKHKSSVLVVALSEEICISGGETGKVKVWEFESGNLIKILTGHHAPVMGIKFDRWHIITGGKDGYALVWSTVGQHSRCLTALRHPKEVLCLEFAYLRVVTGSADGRIRIWNMLTGQCCRIMRGNSQSDPILSMNAIGDRITVNTLSSLLVMNFEKVNWDYTMETDKVSPLMRYGSYTEAPLRSQPYSYVRAQRMRKAGASNYKIIHHSSKLPEANTKHALLQHQYRAAQLPHSTRSLSSKSLRNAKRAQSSLKSLNTSSILADTSSCASPTQERYTDVEQFVASSGKIFLPQSLQSASKSKSGKKSASSQFHVAMKKSDDDDKGLARETSHISRRISWAFDKPLVPKGKDISLSEMKALLRSQIRTKTESIVPPDFIYLTVSTIQKSLVKSETNCNTTMNMQDWKPCPDPIRKRPTSSPSRIDPRTKVPVEKLQLEAFRTKVWAVSELSDLSSISSAKMKEKCKQLVPGQECSTTVCSDNPLNANPLNASLQASHPNTLKITIPQGQIIHPVSAGQRAHEQREQVSLATLPPRPLTTQVKLHSTSVQFIPAGIAPSFPGAGNFSQRSKSDLLSSTGQEASSVPMLMYTKEIKEKITKLKEGRKNRQTPLERNPDGRPLGRVSMYSHPLREHVKFQLRTHQQEKEYLVQTKLLFADQRKMETEELWKKKKIAWLALATGKPSEPVKLPVQANEELAQ